MVVSNVFLIFYRSHVGSSITATLDIPSPSFIAKMPHRSNSATGYRQNWQWNQPRNHQQQWSYSSYRQNDGNDYVPRR